jgi:hypothetical protein
MKLFKNTSLAAAAVIGLMAAAAAPAFAGGNHGGGGNWSGSYTYGNTATFDYGAGGEATNDGAAYGGLSGAYSVTAKDVYGGGDAVADTNGPTGANAYSGSHFATTGASGALSAGYGAAAAGSYEAGNVVGGGMATVSQTWSQGYTPTQP